MDGGRTYPSKLSDDHRQEYGHGGRGGERRRRACGPHVVERLKRPVLGGCGVSRALHRRHTAAGPPIFFRGRMFFAMHRTAEGQRTFHADDHRRDRGNSDETLRAIRVRIMYNVYKKKRKKCDGKRTRDRQAATAQVVTGGLTRDRVTVFVILN